MFRIATINDSTFHLFYETIYFYFSTEYEDVIESHMEKMPGCGNGAMWRCRTCFKMHKKKGDMRRHCETHIEGLSYTCTQCGVEKKSSTALRMHLHAYHPTI